MSNLSAHAFQMPTKPALDPSGAAYLDLIEGVITGKVYGQPVERHRWLAGFPVKRQLVGLTKAAFAAFGLEVVRRVRIRDDEYQESGHAGANRPEGAMSMLGMRQFKNMRDCVIDVVSNGVAGDFLEAGVWRGGMTIYMRALLRALGVSDRKVYVADSFAGLPPASKEDESAEWFVEGEMAVSLEEVKANFTRLGLLDDLVQFVKGYFINSLPGPVGQLAILRADADLYESTLQILKPLYPKLSPGGWFICDDYVNIPGVRQAVDEYRTANGITAPIQKIDTHAICWQK